MNPRLMVNHVEGMLQIHTEAAWLDNKNKMNQDFALRTYPVCAIVEGNAQAWGGFFGEL